jgi:hypothetical protein
MVLTTIHETQKFIWLFGGCGAAKQHSFFWSRISYEVLPGRGYEKKARHFWRAFHIVEL